MSKLNQFSKNAFGWLLHSVLSLVLINWVIETPTFYGIGIYEIALFLLGCTALIRLYYEKGNVFRAIFRVIGSAKWSAISVTAYLLLGAVTVLYAKTPGYALDKYLLVVQMLFVGICMFYRMAERPGARQGFYLNIGLTAVFIAVYSLGKYLLTKGSYPAVVTPGRDYNLYSTILLMGLLCAVAYVAELPVTDLRKCSLLALFTGILMPMVLVSGSRRSYIICYVLAAGILLYAAVLAIKAIKARKTAWKRAVCTLVMCVLCVSLASSAMTKTVYTLSHRQGSSPDGTLSVQDRLEADSGLGKRLLIWDAAIGELQQYDTKAILIGKGASHSSDLYDDPGKPYVLAVHEAYNKSQENPAEKNWMNPHNLFLKDMLDGGILLLLSLLAVMGTALFYSIRILRANPAKGIGILLMYAILLLTMFLSSGKGLLAHKFFWLITFLQILECHRIKTGQSSRKSVISKKIAGSIKTVFRKGLVHILAGSFMTKLVSMFGSIFLVRILSKSEYGVLSYLDNIYGYIHVLAGMGMANMVLRYVVLGDTPQKKYGYFRHGFRSALLWNGIMVVLAGLIFTVFYPHKQEYSSYTWLLAVMFLMLPLQNITELALNNERAMFANQRYAVFSLILSVAVIAGKISAGALGGIRAVVFGQLAVYGLLALILYLSTHKRYYYRLQPTHLTKTERSETSKYALQYMITNGLWAVFMLNDTFLLGRFCAPEVLADYRVAYTIPGCVNLISSAIGIFVGPYFVRNENDLPWIRRKFKLVYGASAAAVGLTCLGVGLLAKPVVWLLYGEQYLNIVPVMRLLLLAAFCNCALRYTTANLLAAMGQVKYNMLVSAIGMALQIGINLYVVPRYGATGVALTSCEVYLFMAAALMIVFLRKYFRKEK